MRPLSVPAQRLLAAVRRLGTRRAQGSCLVAAMVLALPSVGPHRALDDYVLSLIARGEGARVGLPRGGLDLFTFTTGDPDGNRRLMDVGLMLPWWTDPELRISFFRPLSSLTHLLDERLWAGSPVLMHLHSLAWFGVMLVAALLAYRRLERAAVTAGFAFFLYAVDDAHVTALSWIANRNALIATALGFVTLALHDAWRRDTRRAAGVGAVVAFILALLAGEAAVGALAYLAAYALFVEEGPKPRRVFSLAPYGVVLVVWRVLWSRGGFGARGSGAYLDPIATPGAFLSRFPGKLVTLVQGQFLAPPSDVAFLGPPSDRPKLFVLALVTTVLVVSVLVPVVRRDPSSRFWALGTALALVPLGATFPSDRLLTFAGFGASALLARLFEPWLARLAAGEERSTVAAWFTGALFLTNAIAAPLLTPLRAGQMELFGVAHDRAARDVPSDPSVVGKTVVIVAAPTLLFANYIQAQRELAHAARPAQLYVLASASSAIEVARTGPSALTLRPARGFLYTPLEEHYRGTPSMKAGDRIALSAMTASIAADDGEGRPTEVTFTFDRPPADYVFLTWSDGHYAPFTWPAKGDPITLPEQDFGQILAKTALGR